MQILISIVFGISNIVSVLFYRIRLILSVYCLCVVVSFPSL